MSYTIWPDGKTGDVLEEVYRERNRQQELKAKGKFKWTCDSPSQSDARKLTVLAEEFGEVSREVCDSMIADDKGEPGGMHLVRLRKELIQVAAVAVAWAEALPLPVVCEQCVRTGTPEYRHEPDECPKREAP